MDLTPAETALIEMLRGEVETDFALSVVRTVDTVIVTMSSASDGVNVGAGQSFDAALLDLCGRSDLLPPPRGGEAVSRPALRLVGGTGLRADDAHAA